MTVQYRARLLRGPLISKPLAYARGTICARISDWSVVRPRPRGQDWRANLVRVKKRLTTPAREDAGAPQLILAHMRAVLYRYREFWFKQMLHDFVNTVIGFSFSKGHNRPCVNSGEMGKR